MKHAYGTPYGLFWLGLSDLLGHNFNSPIPLTWLKTLFGPLHIPLTESGSFYHEKSVQTLKHNVQPKLASVRFFKGISSVTLFTFSLSRINHGELFSQDEALLSPAAAVEAAARSYRCESEHLQKKFHYGGRPPPHHRPQAQPRHSSWSVVQ